MQSYRCNKLNIAWVNHRKTDMYIPTSERTTLLYSKMHSVYETIKLFFPYLPIDAFHGEKLCTTFFTSRGYEAIYGLLDSQGGWPKVDCTMNGQLRGIYWS